MGEREKVIESSELWTRMPRRLFLFIGFRLIICIFIGFWAVLRPPRAKAGRAGHDVQHSPNVRHCRLFFIVLLCNFTRSVQFSSYFT